MVDNLPRRAESRHPPVRITSIHTVASRHARCASLSSPGGTRLSPSGLLVEIHTDEGIVGVGEAPGSALSTIRTNIEAEQTQFLVGQDPLAPSGSYTALRSSRTGLKIRIDADMMWSVSAAIKWIRGLEHFALQSVEQPVPDFDCRGWRARRSRTTTSASARPSTRDQPAGDHRHGLRRQRRLLGHCRPATALGRWRRWS